MRDDFLPVRGRKEIVTLAAYIVYNVQQSQQNHEDKLSDKQSVAFRLQLIEILEVAVGVDHKFTDCGFVAGNPRILVKLES